MALHLGQEVGAEPQIAHEVERDHPHFSVHFAHLNKHRPLAEDPPDAARVTALEQLPLVLKNEAVQPCVGGDDGGLPEEIRPINLPMPERKRAINFSTAADDATYRHRKQVTWRCAAP